MGSGKFENLNSNIQKQKVKHCLIKIRIFSFEYKHKKYNKHLGDYISKNDSSFLLRIYLFVELFSMLYLFDKIVAVGNFGEN